MQTGTENIFLCPVWSGYSEKEFPQLTPQRCEKPRCNQMVSSEQEKAMAENELQSGDYAIFWTVGAGTTCACSTQGITARKRKKMIFILFSSFFRMSNSIEHPPLAYFAKKAKLVLQLPLYRT